MQIELQHRPGNSAAKITLQPGESITTEGGAMIAMSNHLHIETTTRQKGGSGGVLKALKRLVGGESFFLNHYTAPGAPGELYLAATLPGDMMTYDLDGETLIVQATSYVAAGAGVEVDTGWQGFKSILSGESLFWLNLKGRGPVVLSSFGAIYPVEVDGEYIVDTGHIVAFNETLNFTITKAGGSWLTAILGGEGLVCKFQGRGTVWCQSHNPSGFGHALGPLLKAR